MKSLFVAGLGFAVLSAGCVRAPHFRYVQSQPECFDSRTDPFPGAPGERRNWPSLDCLHTLYRVGFIEFKENGEAVDRVQKQKALALIDEARHRAIDGKVIAVVYVHGWKNNASEAGPGGEAKDVEKFKNALTELGYRSFAAARQLNGGKPAPIPIVGIYMAWRGKSLMGPDWFTFVSYWPRRNTANHVGDGPDFAPTLNHIIAKVNEGNTGSRIVLIGHSFGARVLEHAIEKQADRVQLYTSTLGASPTDVSRIAPLVDLTLYVNSANDARLSMSRIESLQTNPVRVHHPDYDAATCEHPKPEDAQRCGDYPLLVAITSQGDMATKILLPVANTINLDKGPATPAPPPKDRQYLDPIPPAGLYKRSAAGHMPFLQSHLVREIACPAIPDLVLTEDRQAAIEARTYAFMHPSCAVDDDKCQFVFRTQDDSPRCFKVDRRLPAKSGTLTLTPFNETSFWIMNVDPVVIRDHGDIWNLSFVEMLAQLMAPRGFFDPAKGRVQLSAP